MALTHVNCRGDTYYLHKGTTKKGNPKYYFSKKSDGELLDSIPEGYEIYETPNGQVFLSRIKPKVITDNEKALIEKGIKKYAGLEYFKLDVKGNTVTIFLRDQTDQDFEHLREMFFAFNPRQNDKYNNLISKIVNYSPMMRFILEEEDERIFRVERYCFRGFIDDWIFLDSGSLSELVPKYCEHLGKESFFDLV